jgi:Prolyl oligopeptidase family
VCRNAIAIAQWTWRARFALAFAFVSALMADAAAIGLSEPDSTGNTDEKRDHKRPVTIEDAIEMTRLADSAYAAKGNASGAVVIFSPDKTKFVAILRKGNIQTNRNEFSIVLWQTRDVLRAPNNEVILRLESSSNRPAIEAVRWIDSETIAFLGEHPNESHQLYHLNCLSRELTKITNSPTNLISFDIAGDNVLAYTAEALQEGPKLSWQRFGRPISTELITDVLLGHPDEQWSDHVRVVLQRDGAKQPTQVLAESFLMPFPSPEDHPVVSPDGRYVLLLANSDHIPTIWKEYSDILMQKWTRWNLAPGQYSMLRRWILFDAKTRIERPLVDAPVSFAGVGSEAVWLPDSRSVVITNTYLPLDGVSGEERESRRKGPFVAEVHVPSGEISKLSSEDLTLLRRETTHFDLVFAVGRNSASGAAPGTVRFHKQGNEWLKVTKEELESRVPELALEEGLNLPPRIVATDGGSNRRVLLDLNPQFEKMKFGRVEQIRWEARDGHEVEGGLYYPADFVPGRRYPLVIQTHGFQPDRFQIDGPYTSVFAAQPLAAKGMMVLQAEKPERSAVLEHLATEAEARWRISAYEGAIDYLDARGLIDRSRVGIMGFSRTCWYVKYALTHSSFPFAAVAVSDGIDMGYFIYASMANRGYPDDEMEQIMGGIASGDGMATWSREAPGFQVERMSSEIPVRVVAAYPLDVLVEWEWFAMMQRLRKPVDMVVFLDGVHVLEKPLNRLVSQGGNVDWFDFWLNGHEDGDPAKAEQYNRWRKLRNQIEASRASGNVIVPGPETPGPGTSTGYSSAE